MLVGMVEPHRPIGRQEGASDRRVHENEVLVPVCTGGPAGKGPAKCAPVKTAILMADISCIFRKRR
jgi:hypothetical protein